MSHLAGKIIKRYGATDESYSIYLEQASKCTLPLDYSELNTVFNRLQEVAHPDKKLEKD